MYLARGTLKSLSGLLKWLTAKSGENAFLAVGASAAVAAAVVVVLHWLQAGGLGSGDVVLAALPVGVAGIAAVGCWAFALWLFWDTRLDPNRPGYALAVVLSVVMICVSLEAFAGLSTLLWQRGVIRSATSSAPSLWRAEGHYLWHVVGSVPLLSVPRTLGWRDPQPFTDHISGALLLVFKIAIIAPLIRLGLSGYQFFEARRVKIVAKREKEREQKLAKQAMERREQGGKPLGRPPRVDGGWWIFAGLVMTLGIAVAVVIRSNSGSWMDRWLGRLPPEVSVGNFHLPLSLLHSAPQLLAAAGLIAMIITLIIPSLRDGVNPDTVRSMPNAAVAILAYLLLLALLTFTAAAASLALLRVGVAASYPQIPPRSQPLAAVNTYTWAIADALPGPNIPTTLNWTLQYRFVDRWSEVLLLVYKMSFFAVLLFPLYRIIRVSAYTEWSRHVASADSSLSAAHRFRERLLDIQAILDLLEGRSISATRQKKFGSTPYPAKTALNDLESELEKVRSLFGDSVVIDKANDAELAARSRYERSTMMSYGRGFISMPIDLDELRATLWRSISQYSRSVTEALNNEADEQLYRTK